MLVKNITNNNNTRQINQALSINFSKTLFKRLKLWFLSFQIIMLKKSQQFFGWINNKAPINKQKNNINESKNNSFLIFT